ncbi:hypothetical protein BDV12DRAFT_123772 [Aspergillus spectabilis]
MMYRKRRFCHIWWEGSQHGTELFILSEYILAALPAQLSDLPCFFGGFHKSGLGYKFGWDGFLMRFFFYKDLERRERYTSCIGWDLFRVATSFYLLHIFVSNLSTFFLFRVYDWGLVPRRLLSFRSIGCESMDWIAFNVWSPTGIGLL